MIPGTVGAVGHIGLLGVIDSCLYGGLAQQEPTDPSGIMSRLRRWAAEREDIVYPGQYDNENASSCPTARRLPGRSLTFSQNWRAHEAWTGVQISEQLPEINVFCTTVGTGGMGPGLSTNPPRRTLANSNTVPSRMHHRYRQTPKG